MKPLIVTLLIFIGFFREKDIKLNYHKYDQTEVVDNIESWPVCPVPVETDNYVETSNSLFEQEKLKPIVILIPEDIRCDGLLCPIPPIEEQLNRADPELSSILIQDFLPIVQYIELLMTPTENKTSLNEELMDLFSLEKFIILLDLLCLYWYYKKGSEKDKEDASAKTECNVEENEDEEAEHIRESAVPSDCTYFFQHEHLQTKSKKKRLGFNVRKSFCRPHKTKRNGTNERKELSRLFLHSIRQCIQRDM
ncbi:hypothetical protein XENTR_v10019578 [Xenopus tropicalis]|nr:hypothetical protein XENTR_v10019578 [Xenopus tropicalis]